MSDWVVFEGRIETLEWGRAVYTVLRLPEEAVAGLSGARRVEGEFGEHPVNLAISRAPVVEGAFLWTGQSLLDRTGLRPGEVVEVRLRPAPDDVVDTPPDLAAAMAAGGASAAWDSLTPGKKRGLLYKIDTAKTDATRAKRIAALVAELGA